METTKKRKQCKISLLIKTFFSKNEKNLKNFLMIKIKIRKERKRELERNIQEQDRIH